jgi:minor extracellular serine protease Vpr
MFLRSVAVWLLGMLAVLPGTAQTLKKGPFVPNQYILILADPPVAERFASRDLLRTAGADSYRLQVEARQQGVKSDLAARNIKVLGSVSTVLNAVFVSATGDRFDELRALAGVAGVRPVRRGERHINKATQLANAPVAWTAVGGQANAGKGILIAILDSGIDQTHPAFQDTSLTVPSGFPKCNAQSDCQNFTNNKVIVARSYVPIIANADPRNPDPTSSTPDDYSARDRDGHGTAVASVAAATTTTGSVTFNGMAPKAYLGNYKVYGSPGVNDFPPETVWEQAIEDALTDGQALSGQVVAVFSSGVPAMSGPLDQGATCGLSGTAACDPLATAFENAAKGGLVIAASAGNDGSSGLQYPSFASVSSPAFAPSVLAAGATTNSHVLLPGVSVIGAPANLQHIAAQGGDSLSALSFGIAVAQNAPLIDVAQLGNDGNACTALPANSLNNAFALILNGGTCTPATKTTNAQNAGAVGVILYMSNSSPPAPPEGVDQFTGPVVMVANSDGLALKSYIEANPGAVATIDLAGTEQDLTSYSTQFQFVPALAANQLASYSSQGPALGSYAIKPDLVATGGLDVSLMPDPNDTNLPPAPGMYIAAQNFDPLGAVYSPNRFAAANGTSFSAPLVGGAAALIRQKYPSYTAAQVRSALVNTTSQDVTVDDFGNLVNTEWIGAGRLDAGAASAATVTAEPSNLSFGLLKSGSSLPSPIAVSLVNHGSSSVTLAAAVVTKVAATGASVAVDKSGVTIGAGASATLNVSLSGAVPAAGAYSGAVTLQGSGVSLQIPYMFFVGSGTAFNVPFILGDSDGIAGQQLGYWGVQVTDSFGVAVANSPVGFSASPRGSMTFASAPGEPACSPASSTSTISCPTDNYGYAWVLITLGPNPGTPTITVNAAGNRIPIGLTSRVQPTISSGGVLPAANVDAGTPVAPGSYVAIYGTGLSDVTDSNTFTMLPLSLDGVTASVDLPSAHLSLPASFTFVSPNQVNVQVPWELQGQSSAQVKVTINEFEYGNVVTVPLSDYSPAFFHGVADALDTNYQVITASHPAQRGQVIQLYVNGLGPVTNQPASGAPAVASPLSQTKQSPVVTIGGQQAQALFSGLAPGFPGLYQVNVTVPTGVTPGGAVPITIAIGGKTSKQATIPVQ